MVEIVNTGYASTIEQMVREMEMALLPRDYNIPDTLFHYTDSAGLLGILGNHEIWATHYDCLNDSSELNLAKSLVQTELTELIDKMGDMERAVVKYVRELHEKHHLTSMNQLFISSFSQEPDDLSQWRAYGSDGYGYAVGLTIKPDSTGNIANELPCLLTSCLYDASEFRARVRRIVEQIVDMIRKYAEMYRPPDEQSADSLLVEAVSCALSPIAYQEMGFKNSYFRNEREWRLCFLHDLETLRKGCQFRATSSGITPYMKVPFKRNDPTFRISKVVVGPRGDVARRMENVEILLARSQIEGCEVVASGIPYRGK